MKPKVLISAPYALPVIERYKAALGAAGAEVVVAPVRERLEEADLLPLVKDVAAIICGDDRITARVLEAAPLLRVIAKWGTGIDSIDRETAKARGVQVLNTPNAFSEPVADTAMGYILFFARRPAEMDRAIREGRWEKPQLSALNERTLGIVGVGNCGKAVARRAAAFGMRLLGNDVVKIDEAFTRSVGLEMTDLEPLLRTADYVTLHCDLNQTSHGLIGEPQLELMKRDAVLINTARGPIVREAALAKALEQSRIRGAALDVFEEEPLPADSPLRKLPNCLLAPHNANSSAKAAEHVHANTIANCLRGLGLEPAA